MNGQLPVLVAALIACPEFGANGEGDGLGPVTPLPMKTAGLPGTEDVRAMTASIESLQPQTPL
jgi:hypothetical protein